MKTKRLTVPAALMCAAFLTLSSLAGPLSGRAAPFSAAAAGREAQKQIYTFTTGSVRVQTLSDSVVRLEDGSSGYVELDTPTYYIENRELGGVACAQAETKDGFLVVAGPDYRVYVPQDASSLAGSYIMKNEKKVWEYTGLPSNKLNLPDPGQTPEAFAIADDPRVVPGASGYAPQAGGSADNGWVQKPTSGDMYIFLTDGDAKKLRQDFVDLTGHTDMIDLKMLGLWDSYAGQKTAAEQLSRIDKYRALDIPVDVKVNDLVTAVLDPEINNWVDGEYEVNKALYGDDIKTYFDAAKERHVLSLINDHPKPRNGANALDAAELLFRNTNLNRFLSSGLDYWWYDRNWGHTLISPYAGISSDSFGLYLYNNVASHYYAANKTGSYARRTAVLGNVEGLRNDSKHALVNFLPDIAAHRWSVQWTGDIYGSSDALEAQIRLMTRLGAQNIIPYVSADIGGFQEPVDSFVYTRWSQFGAFSPIMRYHGPQDHAPWNFGDSAMETARSFIQMRYRLAPVYYQLMRETYDTGMPPVRRLDYSYPQYAESADNSQYLIGDNILAAPISQATGTLSADFFSHLENGAEKPGLQAEYYANENLSGSPAVQKVDATPIVNVNVNGPGPVDGVDAENFSVRWQGKIKIGTADTRLSLTVDDGVRLWVDGKLEIDSWQGNDTITYATTTEYPAGSAHDIKIEYFNGFNNGRLFLMFENGDSFTPVDTRSVFLPDGTWIDVWSGQQFTGPKTITVSHPLQTMPLFIRKGAAIPLVDNTQYMDEKPWDTVALDIYPDETGAANTATLYEDDGKTEGYQDGQSRTTLIQTAAGGNSAEIHIQAAQGRYEGAVEQRTWKLRLHAPAGTESVYACSGATELPAVKIAKSANAQPFAFSGAAPDADVFEITLSDVDVSEAASVSVTFNPDLNIIPIAYNGFADQNENSLMAFSSNASILPVIENGALRMTPGTDGGMAGAAYYGNRVKLGKDRAFSAHFSFTLDPQGSEYGDGLVFVLNASGPDQAGFGSIGMPQTENWSYDITGEPARRWIGFEFDTFDNHNGGAWNEPNGNHIAYTANNNGSQWSSQMPGFTRMDLKDGKEKFVWIEFKGIRDEWSADDVHESGGAHKDDPCAFHMTVSNTPSRGDGETVTFTVPARDIYRSLMNEVYVGFTSAKNGVPVQHDIHSLYFQSDAGGIDPVENKYRSQAAYDRWIFEPEQKVIPVAYADFTDKDENSLMVLSSSAATPPVIRNGALKMTPGQSGSMGNAAYYGNRVKLGRDRTFSAHFSFTLDPQGGGYGDGLVFVLNSDGPGQTGFGSIGMPQAENWSYEIQSDPARRWIGFEFDTFDNHNGGAWNEPNGNHIGYNANNSGTPWSAQVDGGDHMPGFTQVDLKDGKEKFVWLEFEGISDSWGSSDVHEVSGAHRDDPCAFHMTVSNTPSRADGETVTFTVPAKNIYRTLMSEVYVGFTSMKNESPVQQNVHSFYFASDDAGIDLNNDTYRSQAAQERLESHVFTVTFHSQGGSAVGNAAVRYGALIPKPEDPTKTDCAFGGWYRDAACTQAWDFATDPVMEDATLYAKWEPLRALTGITVDLPAKTVFYEGEDVSLSGLLVTARYSDGLCRVVSDYDISSYDLTVGVKNITVTYQGMSAGFQIEIRPNGELPETTVWVAHRLTVKQYLYSLMNRDAYMVTQNGVQVGPEKSLATGMILCRVETGRVVQTAKIIVAGDLNGDGVVNALDITLGKQHILENLPLAELYREALDLNQDGAANVLDLVQMKRELAGLNP